MVGLRGIVDGGFAFFSFFLLFWSTGKAKVVRINIAWVLPGSNVLQMVTEITFIFLK
jgi:hypothetical protein